MPRHVINHVLVVFEVSRTFISSFRDFCFIVLASYTRNMAQSDTEGDRIIFLGCCCYCIVVLRPQLTAIVMSGRSVILTTLFLGRLRPPKWLTGTVTALLQSADGITKVCGRTGYKTRDLWV